LKAELTQAGHQVDVHYLNLELSAELGPDLYAAISGFSGERAYLLGEWLFGVAAFSEAEESDLYLAEFPEIADKLATLDYDLAALRKLREETLPAWVERCATSVRWEDFELIGFTSTFEQNVAALALGAAIKRRLPDSKIIFGGANFDGEMGREFIREFGWIDYVALGEGDVALPALAAAIANGTAPREVPGVEVREGAVVHPAKPAAMARMPDIPAPCYDDYYAALGRLGPDAVLGRRRTRLVVELSRGCWWGEKHHCTFCGLNAAGMEFRSKPASQAYDEVVALAQRYQALNVDAVDNIMDMSYLGELCDKLESSGIDLNVFFEVKANLSRTQLGGLSKAGIKRIQPGLESLSTHLLGLMRKGSTMAMNVRLLKWAHYYDMSVVWNILCGFPGERDEDYYNQAELIPALHHLPPPTSVGRLWLERYSPYFTEKSDYISNVRPIPAYRHAYPQAGLELARIAYFFDYDVSGVASPEAHQAVVRAVEQWRERWRTRRPQLTYRRGPGFITLHDSRAGAVSERVIAGWRARVLERCGDSYHSAGKIAADLQSSSEAVGAAEVREFLDDCVAQRLVIADGGRYLGLALPSRKRA
jgi:ribosomal peptide maturation radical SAM protein 1